MGGMVILECSRGGVDLIFLFLAAKSPAELGKSAAVALWNYRIDVGPDTTGPVRSTTIGLQSMSSNMADANRHHYYTSMPNARHSSSFDSPGEIRRHHRPEA